MKLKYFLLLFSFCSPFLFLTYSLEGVISPSHESGVYGDDFELSFAEMQDIDIYFHFEESLDKNDIKVTQDDSTSDPYHNYAGCATRSIFTNFPADVKATIAARAGSLATGADTKWTVTLKAPGGTAAEKIMIPQGTTPVDICVKGTKINLEALTGGAEKVPVADITIHFIRAGFLTS